MHQHIAARSDGPLPAQPLGLAVWQRVTRAAIAAERSGQHASALDGYRRALDIANQLMKKVPTGQSDDCVAALVVSHHNLADHFASHDGHDAAVAHLCSAHDALVSLLLDTQCGEALRHAALRHSRETHRALIQRAASHGDHPRIAHSLRAGRAALGDDPANPH